MISCDSIFFSAATSLFALNPTSFSYHTSICLIYVFIGSITTYFTPIIFTYSIETGSDVYTMYAFVASYRLSSIQICCQQMSWNPLAYLIQFRRR